MRAEFLRHWLSALPAGLLLVILARPGARPSRAALGAALAARSATPPGCVPILERKGLLACDEAGRPRVANVFLARWLLARTAPR